MTYYLIPTGASASLPTIDAALAYANEFVADGFASSYEIEPTVSEVYGNAGFRVTFFRAA